MTSELIAIFGMAVTIVIAVGVMFQSLHSDMHDIRDELKSDITRIKTELVTDIASAKNELSADIAYVYDGQNTTNDRLSALSERMAHLEGLLEGLREAITGRSAA